MICNKKINFKYSKIYQVILQYTKFKNLKLSGSNKLPETQFLIGS